MHPVVLLPDLKDVILKRTTLKISRRDSNGRIPFSKVNPSTVKGNFERSKPGLRRNATRACRTNLPQTTLSSSTEMKKVPNERRGRSRSSSTIIKSKSAPRSEEYDVSRLTCCKYCRKQFRVAEFADVSPYSKIATFLSLSISSCWLLLACLGLVLWFSYSYTVLSYNDFAHKPGPKLDIFLPWVHASAVGFCSKKISSPCSISVDKSWLPSHWRCFFQLISSSTTTSDHRPKSRVP